MHIFCWLVCSEVGKAAQLLSFSGSMVQVRRADGALIQLHTLPYPGLLHTQVTRGLWPAALRLCRSAKVCGLFTLIVCFCLFFCIFCAANQIQKEIAQAQIELQINNCKSTKM